MQARIIEITSKQDVMSFVNFPFKIYRKHPQWVPPIKSMEANKLDFEKNPFFEHSEAAFILVEDGKEILGRIGVLNNRRYNQTFNKRVASFTMLDFVEDIEVVKLLFQSAEDWSKERGLNVLHGPHGFQGTDTSGILVDGFEHRPAVNVSYNYPYYGELLEQVGFKKHRDSLSGYADVKKTEVSPRLERIANRAMKRSGYWIKRFEDKNELWDYVDDIRDIYYEAFGDRGDYLAHTDREIQKTAGDLISLAHPSLIKLVMKEEKLIGFIFAYHDIGEALQKANGSLFPFGWWHLMRAQKNSEWVNVNGFGVLPKYQGLGANAILLTEVTKTIKSFNFKHCDTVMIGEENFPSFSDNLTMGVKFYKRHRVYHKAIG